MFTVINAGRALVFYRRSARIHFIALASLLAGVTAFSQPPGEEIVVFDGTNLDGFVFDGEANWHLAGDVVEATEGNGYLVVKDPYADFILTLEFWVASSVNSGVYLRCPAPDEHGGRICYEVQIHDYRPNQIYRTGGIVRHRSPAEHVNSVGQWNSYEIRAEGEHITVTLNGIVTAEIENDDYICEQPCAHRSDGYIALQYNDDSGGVLKFRNVRIQPL